jgi:hypothetical protein
MFKQGCKMCNPNARCEHKKNKKNFGVCTPSIICHHHKRRADCKECNGCSIREHNKFKSHCPDCDGSLICKSRKEPYKTGCRQRGNRKYGGFCTHCFANAFPDDPKTEGIRKKSKELRIINHISRKYEGFIHDKPCYVGFREWLLFN